MRPSLAWLSPALVADLILKVTSIWNETSPAAHSINNPLFLCRRIALSLLWALKSPLGFLLLKSCANRSLVKLLIRTEERGYKLQTSQFPELLKNLVQSRDINISYHPTAVSQNNNKNNPILPVHHVCCSIILSQIKILPPLIFFMTLVPVPL